MFLNNAFSKKYFDIIKNNQIVDIESVYCEKHHIIPKSFGGSNKKENTVYLTAKDHFRCHQLLINFTKGADNGKMWNALWRMMRLNLIDEANQREEANTLMSNIGGAPSSDYSME
jgi:hypothetical protein